MVALQKNEDDLIRFALNNDVKGYNKVKDNGRVCDDRLIFFEGESVTWKAFRIAYSELPFDIETHCGACGAFNYDHIQPLLDNQNGVVHCYNCGKNYMASSHLTSDSINKLNSEFLTKAKGM